MMVAWTGIIIKEMKINRINRWYFGDKVLEAAVKLNIKVKGNKGMKDVSFFKKKKFIYLAALGLRCGMWDLVSWPGLEPGPPALGAWCLNRWTTMEVLEGCLLILNLFLHVDLLPTWSLILLGKNIDSMKLPVQFH